VVGKGSLAELEWVHLSPTIPAAGTTTSWTNVLIDASQQVLYRVRLTP
jgi:hypothetical protein